VTQAGWYPDPAGQPQTYRYWDGTSWSQDTTSDPYAPPPAPPPPAYGFRPAPPSGGSRGSGLTVLLVAVAVLVLIGLSVGGFFGYRALAGADGDDTDASDRSSATDTATTEPTTDATTPTDPTTAPTTPTDTTTTDDTEVTDQQCRGGVPTPSVTPGPDATEISGGALSIPVPAGYSADTSYAAAFTFADQFTPLQKVIEQAGSDYGWVSIYGVGGLRKANGFDDPEQAAAVVMTCMSQSTELYSHFTGREDLRAGALTVDGTDAFQITSELRVDDPDLKVEGDVAQVIVVDMGNPGMFGLYITVVPIGDQKLIRQQEAMVGKITVD
jgi:hypothetical protein